MKVEKGASRAIATKAHVLVIEARFYAEICDELARGAIAALTRAGATHERVAVPGALEIACADAHHFGAEQRVGRGDDAAGRDASRAEDADSNHGVRVSHDCARCGTLWP